MDEINERILAALVDLVAAARAVVEWCPKGHPELETRLRVVVEIARGQDGIAHLDELGMGEAVQGLMAEATETMWGCRFDHDDLTKSLGELRALLATWADAR